MKNMQEEIKKIKEFNGNNNYKSQDLLWYLVAKVDKIDDKLDTKVNKVTFRMITGGLFTLILFLLGIIVVT